MRFQNKGSENAMGSSAETQDGNTLRQNVNLIVAVLAGVQERKSWEHFSMRHLELYAEIIFISLSMNLTLHKIPLKCMENQPRDPFFSFIICILTVVANIRKADEVNVREGVKLIQDRSS